MKKFRNWMGAFAAIALVLVVVLMIPATSVVNQRKNAFRPLSDETLRQISTPQDAVSQNGLSRLDNEPSSDFPDSGAVPADHPKEAHAPSVESARLTSLTRTLTSEDLINLFRPGTNPLENAYESLLGKGLRLKDSLAWAAGNEDNGQTALHIGWLAMSNGDIDEARDYLRAALDANIRSGDLSLRPQILGSLAWAEDDPEVAAMLLEASCSAARPIDEEFVSFYVQDALALSILTGSHALAEHYYARWNALEPGKKPLVNLHLDRGRSELIDAWFDEHHPEFYKSVTPWDPMEKSTVTAAKSVG